MHTRRCVEPGLLMLQCMSLGSGVNLRREISTLSRKHDAATLPRVAGVQQRGLAWFIKPIYRIYKIKSLDLRAI